ncbi:MAG TPA: flagellar biosynthetic protein FliR [Smithellaceae bacterium]|nr:flagellar biosynthetic protein FliR [Smithellaceae bacterium]
MNLPLISAEHIEAFILVLLRVSAIVVTIPVISDKAVPVRFKAALSVLITLIVFPLVLSKIPKPSQMEAIVFMYRMAGEVLIGVIIGFVARLVFTGIQIAGNLIGFQMGFAIANVIDPLTSDQVSIIAEFQYLMAMLVFLVVDAHHIFFSAIVQSYTIVNPFSFHFSGQLMQLIFDFSKNMFVVAVKIGAPLMAVMLFTNVVLGIIARTVPQINVFIVGFPLQIAMGLVFIGITAPLFVKMTQGLYENLGPSIMSLLRSM